MRRVIAIVAACVTGWFVYMVAMMVTVYDGLLSLIFQPIVVTVVVVGSLIVGLVFHIPPVGRAWRRAPFLAPAITVGSIALMCSGTRLGLTQTFTDHETGRQWVGLHRGINISSFLVMVFTITNWPVKSNT
jgi:hypothetical protein